MGEGAPPSRPEEGVRRENRTRARAIVETLVASGVRLLVVAPGSRSTPLVLAAHRHPELETLVQVDERSAAFVALGAGKVGGAPAAVLTTSGTAVANLVPAAVEAERAEAPLLLLTADRPPRLRDADANQVVDQLAILRGVVRHQVELHASTTGDPDDPQPWVRRAVRDAVASALGDPAGPVHLNVPFEKPLEPGDDDDEPAGSTSGAGPMARHRVSPDPAELEALADLVARARRPLLVGGRLPRPEEAGPPLGRLARVLGGDRPIPLLADPLSGARGASMAGLSGYDLLLSDNRLVRALAPDLVLRLGASPTSARLLGALEVWTRGGAAPLVVVDGGERSKDHQALASHALRADPALLAEALARQFAQGRHPLPVLDTGWAEAWAEADQVARQAGARVVGERGGEPALALALGSGELMDADDLLFVSSSMPIRDVDAHFAPRVPPRVLANRGASGIDGIVSTALGAARASGRRLTLLLGDLALLHDANGLLALSELPTPVRVLVANNDGGGIFGMLPVAAHDPPFTRHFVTPHGRDLSHLAAFHEMDFVRTDLREGGGPREVQRVLRDRGWGAGAASGQRAGAPLLAEFLTDSARDMETRGQARTEATRAARIALHDLAFDTSTILTEGDA